MPSQRRTYSILLVLLLLGGVADGQPSDPIEEGHPKLGAAVPARTATPAKAKAPGHPKPKAAAPAGAATTAKAKAGAHSKPKAAAPASTATTAKAQAGGHPKPKVAAPASTAKTAKADSVLGHCVFTQPDTLPLESMLEWVRYHVCHGASMFHVYEHNSNTTFAGRYGELEHLVQTTPVQMPKSVAPQAMAYSQCFVLNAHKHRWLAFTDPDEFVVLPGGGMLVDFLPQFSAHPALAMNWKVLGSDGHDRRPPGGLVSHYTACIDDPTYVGSQHVKLILNTELSFGLRSAHVAVPSRNGSPTVLSTKAPVRGHRSIPTAVWSDIQLYHYYTKSKEEWETRMGRGRVVPSGPQDPNWGTFKAINKLTNGTCLLAQEFWGTCRSSIALHH